MNVLIILLILNSLHLFVSSDSAYKILKNLMKDYKKQELPNNINNNSLTTNITFVPVKLNEINTKHQYISLLGFVYIEWYDSRLVWDTENITYINYISVQHSEIWTPKIYMDNPSKGNYIKESYSQIPVKVTSKGSVHWLMGGLFETGCKVDIAYFPFDDQICYFIVGDWIYHDAVIGPKNKGVQSDGFANKQPEWELLDIKYKTVIKQYGLRNYSILIYGIHFKRQYMYYVINLLPSIMLHCLSMSLFYLPVNSGERISLGISIMVAFSLYIVMVNEHIPQSSSSVPYITLYFTFLMGFTAAAIIIGILVSYFECHESEGPPPKWLINLCKRHNTVISHEHTSTLNQWKLIASKIDFVTLYVFWIIFVVFFVLFIFVLPLNVQEKDFNQEFNQYYSF